jgi:hypothetical protein
MRIISDIIKIGDSPRISKIDLPFKYLGCINYPDTIKQCKKINGRLLSGQELLRLYNLDILELFGCKNEILWTNEKDNNGDRIVIRYDHSKENSKQRMIAKMTLTFHAIVRI